MILLLEEKHRVKNITLYDIIVCMYISFLHSLLYYIGTNGGQCAEVCIRSFNDDIEAGEIHIRVCVIGTHNSHNTTQQKTVHN